MEPAQVDLASPASVTPKDEESFAKNCKNLLRKRARKGKKKKADTPEADGLTLAQREDEAMSVAQRLGLDRRNVTPKDAVDIYIKTEEENKKSVRIFLAKSMLPDVGSMNCADKVHWAVKTKAAFSVAIANLGITAGTQQHGDVLSGLMKAVSHRLQIETKKEKFPCSLTQKAGTSDRE